MKIILTILEVAYIIFCIYYCYSKKLKLSHYLKILFFDYGVLNVLLINLMFFLIFNSAPIPLVQDFYYDLYYSTENALCIILSGVLVYYSMKIFLELTNFKESSQYQELKKERKITRFLYKDEILFSIDVIYEEQVSDLVITLEEAYLSLQQLQSVNAFFSTKENKKTIKVRAYGEVYKRRFRKI